MFFLSFHRSFSQCYPYFARGICVKFTCLFGFRTNPYQNLLGCFGQILASYRIRSRGQIVPFYSLYDGEICEAAQQFIAACFALGYPQYGINVQATTKTQVWVKGIARR